MNARDLQLLTNRLIPIPKHLSFQDGLDFLLQDDCFIQLDAPDSPELQGLANAQFKTIWNCSPHISCQPSSWSSLGDPEAYGISISPTEITLTASAAPGLLNALKTLRQLAEPQRGTETVSGYLLPLCTIQDHPACAFRGIHLCIFPETPLWDVEKNLRLAAYHKFNAAIVECWGVFPFQSHPDFCWADRQLDRQELKRLIALAKELGMTMIPQFNLLGHAAAARSITGKHAILDTRPQLQPLFEPEGWSWCISNPTTRAILTDLVLELADFFDTPPYFHIGCDEAHDLGSCSQCRKIPLANLVRDHIVYFHDLLKEKGIRSIMWHDMLLNAQDPRWKGYIACGNATLENLYRELPKDIIIADWQYGADDQHLEQPSWPTMAFFKDNGFQVIGCPWLQPSGTQSIGRFVSRQKLFGFLQTTWQFCHGVQHQKVFGIGANAAWNPEAKSEAKPLALAQHTRQIGWDMKLTDYEQTGWNMAQMDPGYVTSWHEWIG